MPRALPLLLVAAVLAAVGPAAQAACTDAAAPGVQWRRCLLDSSDLSGENLSGADLRDTGFKRVDLSGANLTRVQARRAKFVSSNLQNVDLSEADLVQADFTSADLSGAKLIGASLRSARLFQANLRGADLTRAVLDGADLLRTDFSGARWTDGTTICAEGSLGRCHPVPAGAPAKVEG
jgi:uncharacterized protein YjbI with pentapeptide repeats